MRKVFLDTGSRGLPRVFCTIRALFCTSATLLCASATLVCSLGTNDLLHPLLTTFGSFPIVGHSPRLFGSQLKRVIIYQLGVPCCPPLLLSYLRAPCGLKLSESVLHRSHAIPMKHATRMKASFLHSSGIADAMPSSWSLAFIAVAASLSFKNNVAPEPKHCPYGFQEFHTHKYSYSTSRFQIKTVLI